VIHFADRKNFPNIGEGLWWAIQTVTTVGYGDVVPTDRLGRLAASLVCSPASASSPSSPRRSRRRSSRQRAGGVEGGSTGALAHKVDRISARLEMIEAGLQDSRGHDRSDD
jgi:hypothetical protein